MSVALFNNLIWHTNLAFFQHWSFCKFLIVITMGCRKLILFYRNSNEWSLGGGGKWLVGAQNSAPSAAAKKKQQ